MESKRRGFLKHLGTMAGVVALGGVSAASASEKRERTEMLADGVLVDPPPYPAPNDCTQTFRCNGCYGTYCTPCYGGAYNNSGGNG